MRRHFLNCHAQKELARIAIDEAHCISEWGHDFRPAFKALKWFRENCKGVPIMCLTATATDEVRKDVLRVMGLEESKTRCFRMTTARANLHYEVRFKNDEMDVFDDFLQWLQTVYLRRQESERAATLQKAGERINSVPGIIYALTRNECETIAARLRSKGIGARPYHAGLNHELKAKTLQAWVDNVEGYDIIVATTAFGMGIDKENVRFVIHWSLPKSFEGYYQEAGRAGRDGRASACIMYYSREDRDRAIAQIARAQAADKKGLQKGNLEGRMKSLEYLARYAEETERCRHEMVVRYFGEEEVPTCDWACDWHKDARKVGRRKREGLASEEWVSTQREMGRFGGRCEDDE